MARKHRGGAMSQPTKMDKQWLEAERERVRQSNLFRKGEKIVTQLADRYRNGELEVIVETDPAFWVSAWDYERYRNTFLAQIGKFEDHFFFSGLVVSRSCLLSFVSGMSELLRRAAGKSLLYISLGVYARNETDIVDGIREPVFPQLEVELLDAGERSPDEALQLMLQVEEELFAEIGLEGSSCRVRIGDPDKFAELTAALDKAVRFRLRDLLDDLEEARILEESRKEAGILDTILELVPEDRKEAFREWFSRPFQPLAPVQGHGQCVFSTSLVGGPYNYEKVVFETDYTGPSGKPFVEVLGGGNFTPLARRFGLPAGWLAIGFAAGWLRLYTALQEEGKLNH